MPFTIDSQLMPNHVPGEDIASQQTVALAFAADGGQLLFALDRAHNLTLTHPSATSGTGWAQIDLGAQLAQLPGVGAGAFAQAFAMSQDPDGTVWFAVAVESVVQKQTSVYISTELPHGSVDDWQHLADHLHLREIPDNQGLTVSEIVVGGAGGPHPLVVVVASDPAQGMRYLQLNPDPGPGEWQSMPLPFATDATACLDLAIGRNQVYGPGVYALCQVGDVYPSLSLTFSTLPRLVAGRPVVQTIELDFPGPLSRNALVPHSIAAAPDADGYTELFAAGLGLYRWPVAAQTRSGQPGIPIAGQHEFAGVTRLVAATDPAADCVTVWGIDGHDALVQTTGIGPTPDTLVWTKPVSIEFAVTAVSAVRTSIDSTGSSAALLLGDSDGELSLRVQSPQNSLWSHISVTLPDAAIAKALTTYTTRVQVTDADGIPLSSTTVLVGTYSDCSVLINGVHYALKSTLTKSAQTAVDGVLTLVAETADLVAPRYTFSLVGGPQQDEDAGSHVKDVLRPITTAAELCNAKRADGTDVFPAGEKPTEDSAKAAAEALKQAMAVHDKLAAGLAPPDRATLGAAADTPLFAVRYHAGHSVLLSAEEAAALALGGSGDTVWSDGGDLLSWLFGEDSTIPYWINSAWEFCVTIAETTYKFLVGVVELAFGVVDWVLRKTLGLSIKDLTAWLGYVFNWHDIKRNHRVLARLADLYLDAAVADLTGEQFKKDLGWAFAKARALITPTGINVPKESAFANRLAQAPNDSDGSSARPDANWGAQHLTAGSGSMQGSAVDWPDESKNWADLQKAPYGAVDTPVARLQGALGGTYRDVELSTLFESAAVVVGDTLITAAEDTVTAMVTAAAESIGIVHLVLDAHIQIPILTYVYEEMICCGDGSKLTLLDLACLLAAIPATIGVKALSSEHRDLFTDAQADGVLAAKDWAGACTALYGAPDGSLLGAADLAQVIAGLSIAAATTRTLSSTLFVIRDAMVLADPKRIPVNYAKITFDWLTFGIANVTEFGVTLQKGRAGLPDIPRYGLDRAVLRLSCVILTRDFILAAQGPLGDVGRKASAGLEALVGLAILGLAVGSLILQLGEERPPDNELWKELLVLKFLQNSMTGLFHTLAPLQLDPSGIGFLIRAIVLVVRSAANIARVVLDDGSTIVDYDGPI